jgi:uncharacterized coiled-coil DUF342 family protein
MLGMFKSLFRKDDGNPYSALSAEAIHTKIDEHNHKIAELKRMLPSASVQESVDKSASWMTEIQVKINAAKNKGDTEEADRYEAEIREASKKSDRISKHVNELREQILRVEDEIELLERALAAKK